MSVSDGELRVKCDGCRESPKHKASGGREIWWNEKVVRLIDNHGNAEDLCRSCFKKWLEEKDD